MSAKHSIAPFPADIDREAFGHWLSGFVDGEGYFGLWFKKRPHGRLTLAARFGIKLRADERPVLELIRSFFQCGALRHDIPSRNQLVRGHPTLKFEVVRHADLRTIIVPHFNRFPLRAKKQRDFVLWRQGVELLRGICGIRHDPIHDDAFRKINDALRQQRSFQAETIVPVLPPIEPSLFDGLQ